MLRINTTNKEPNLFGAGKDGFRAGNPSSGQQATELSAAFMNALQEEVAAVVEGGGLTPDPANNAQMLAAIRALIETRVGDYALDTGAANAYVVAINPVITAYTGNFSGSFKVVNANTGASTLNAGGGAAPLVSNTGTALVAGEIASGSVVQYQYIAADAKFYITSVGADARYAALAGLSTQLFSAANGTSGKQVVNISQFAASLTDPGYQTLPGGLLIQWGTGAITAGIAGTVTFPVAFPTTCLRALVIPTGGGATAAQFMQVTGLSATQATFSINSGGPWQFSYVAFGY